MGFDAHVYVFDHAAFVTEVVPAIRSLLLTGALTPQLAELRRDYRLDPQPHLDAVELVRDCTYLRVADLAFEGEVGHERPAFERWSERACRSDQCPSRLACPFHTLRAELADDITELIILAVRNRCLGKSRFVGRTVNYGYYSSLLRGPDTQDSRQLRALLHALGNRGRVIGFSFGGGGIDGWLDPEETRLIAEHLAQLDLPRYERTFEAMEECHRRFRTAQGTPQEAQNPSFQQVSLSYVRTVAEIAAQQGHGILWGNDLPLEASAYHPYL